MKEIRFVLLIDDDEEDRGFFREALQDVDPNVQYFEANNGEEALQLLNKPDAMLPDLIFLDLNMPVVNGKECLQAIMESKKLCHIPVIIYSTSRQAFDKEETKKLGAAHFVTKPVFFNDIRKMISEMLGKNW